MKRSFHPFLKIICLLGFILLFWGYPESAQSAQVGIIDGSNALNVVGQIDSAGAVSYLKGGPNSGPNNRGFSQPRFVTIDTTNHRLFVSDRENNRVLVFNLNSSDQLVDYTADFVLGQANFDSAVAGLTQSGLYWPEGVAYGVISATQYLFVSDSNNSRIMVFDVTSISNGENAVKVLGQANFTSGAVGTTQSTLKAPRGLHYDGAQWLFVADFGNHRVMVFDVADGITNGEDALKVIGQSNFTSGSANRGGSVAANSLNFPTDVFYAPNHFFYVSDQNNSRVLRFDFTTPPGSILPDPSADKVLGQANFTSGTSNRGGAAGNNTLSSPAGLAFRSSDSTLFAGDQGNNRVMIFEVAAITDGEAAINVLGQPNFTTTSSTIDQSHVGPMVVGLGYAATSNQLFVVNQDNNRVMVFNVNPAVITDGESAINVLGQLDTTPAISFTKGSQNNGPLNIGFNSPHDVALDTTNHRLFVSDTSNNRILIFNLNTSDVLDEYTADFVLGQTDFISNSSGTTQSTFNSPRELLYVSASNSLFVADHLNNRILIFNVASITNGENAANVLGQSNFTSNGLSQSQRTFRPYGLAYDTTNSRLFLANGLYHDVYVFDLTGGVVDYEPAVNVLGRPDYTGALPPDRTTQSTLNVPEDVAYDNNDGRLFVADTSNRRVMVFNAAINVLIPNNVATDGPNAVSVLGQANFTSAVQATTQNGFYQTQGLGYDDNNNYLFVSDATGASNHRVMAFDVTAISDGENAVNVLGQPNFTSTGAATTQSRLNDPHGLFFNPVNGQLWVVDQDNHRLMVFVGAAAPPTVSVAPAFVSQATNGTGQVTLSFQVNDTTPSSGVQTKVEHSIDGGTSWRASFLTSVTASAGPAPDLDNNANYQIGSVTRINVTGGANTLNPMIWDTKNILNGNGTLDDLSPSVLIRVTPSDGVTVGTFQQTAAAFNLDNSDPSPPGSFASTAQTTSTVTLNWSAVTETNFNHYEIWYGTSQADVQGRTGGAQEWDHIDDATLATRTTTSTTITGLLSSIGYYFKIWGVDNFGNENTVNDIQIYIQSGSSASTAALSASVNLKVNLGEHRNQACLRMVNQLLKDERMIKDRVTIGDLMRGRAGSRDQFNTITEIQDHAVFRATLLQLAADNLELRKFLRCQSSDHLILEVWTQGDRTSPLATINVSTDLFGEATVTLPTLEGNKSYDFTIRKPFGLRQTLSAVALQGSLDLHFKNPLRVGDVDGDGKINLTDFQLFIDNFKKYHNDPGDYDLNEDGVFDLNDFSDFLQGLKE